MSSKIDTVLSTLTINQLYLVEDQLTNNEVASDDELHTLFHDKGLTLEQATRALQYRDRYLGNMYFAGYTPILKGDDTLCFDTETYRLGPEKRGHTRTPPRAKNP